LGFLQVDEANDIAAFNGENIWLFIRKLVIQALLWKKSVSRVILGVKQEREIDRAPKGFEKNADTECQEWTVP
jgi:hypothetical protein